MALVVVSAVLALGVAELVSTVVLLATSDSLATVRAERWQLATGRAEPVPQDADPEVEALLAELGPTPGDLDREVLHPFLGFVFNPAVNEAEGRRAAGRLEINELGFFRPPGPPAPPDPRAVRVGVFGGSVAFVLAFDVRQPLVEGLARAFATVPELAGRPVVVESYALGGYKQPQQLATLAWLLARGEAPDVVINLDGFNEVALPAVENLPRRTAFDYPRGWSGRVAEVADPALLRRAGKVALLREERQARARVFAAAPWRWSSTATLLWRTLDRGLTRRMAEVALAAGEDRAGAADLAYQARGPFEPPADREEMFRRLARLWAEGSLQMHRLATANGIPYFHFLQPNQYVPGAKPLSPEERAAAFDPDHPYRPPVVEGYPHLRRAGRRLAAAGVGFHDLTEIFAGVEEPLYLDTCCHLNRTGNLRLADAIAAAVAAAPERPESPESPADPPPAAADVPGRGR